MEAIYVNSFAEEVNSDENHSKALERARGDYAWSLGDLLRICRDKPCRRSRLWSVCSGQLACNATCPQGCSPTPDGDAFDCCCTSQLPGDPMRYCCSGRCWRAKCVDARGNLCPRPVERFVCGRGAYVSNYHRCENNYCVGPAPWRPEDPVL